MRAEKFKSLWKVWAQNCPDRPDVFSWILKAYEQGPKTKQDNLDLHGDAYLIIVAGRYRTPLFSRCSSFRDVGGLDLFIQPIVTPQLRLLPTFSST
jgi:hypothetical protein